MVVNFPIGSVEAADEREASASPPDGYDDEPEDKTELNGSASNTVSNITENTSDCEKRFKLQFPLEKVDGEPFEVIVIV